MSPVDDKLLVMALVDLAEAGKTRTSRKRNCASCWVGLQEHGTPYRVRRVEGVIDTKDVLVVARAGLERIKGVLTVARVWGRDVSIQEFRSDRVEVAGRNGTCEKIVEY